MGLFLPATGYGNKGWQQDIERYDMPAMTIKIYTTPNCPYCHQAKDYFQDKNIPFEEIDVSQNQQTLQEMIKISGQTGVPIIDIDGKIIKGYNQQDLDKITSQGGSDIAT